MILDVQEEISNTKIDSKDLEIGGRCKVTESYSKEPQLVIHTMTNANFERRFLVMEGHLAQLAELLVVGANANVNQRYRFEGGRPKSSYS